MTESTKKSSAKNLKQKTRLKAPKNFWWPNGRSPILKNLQPSLESLANAMLYLPESECEFTALYSDF